MYPFDVQWCIAPEAERFKLDTSQVGGYSLIPDSQAMLDSWKCVSLASQFKSSLAAMAGSVALFTHCQAVQLSAMTYFCHPKSKNARKNKELQVSWPKRGLLFYAAHMHVRMSS